MLTLSLHLLFQKTNTLNNAVMSNCGFYSNKVTHFPTCASQAFSNKANFMFVSHIHLQTISRHTVSLLVPLLALGVGRWALGVALLMSSIQSAQRKANTASQGIHWTCGATVAQSQRSHSKPLITYNVTSLRIIVCYLQMIH